MIDSYTILSLNKVQNITDQKVKEIYRSKLEDLESMEIGIREQIEEIKNNQDEKEKSQQLEILRNKIKNIEDWKIQIERAYNDLNTIEKREEYNKKREAIAYEEKTKKSLEQIPKKISKLEPSKVTQMSEEDYIRALKATEKAAKAAKKLAQKSQEIKYIEIHNGEWIANHEGEEEER